MTSDIQFYTLIDANKLKETLDFLEHNQTDITLKIRNKHVRSKIISKKNARELLIYKFNFQDFASEPVICSFEINAEKYFFRSEVSTHSLGLVMQTPNEIFQLQRRDDFRVIVPTGSVYECTIRTMGGKPVKMDAEVRDLSLGGCQLRIPKSEFHIQRDVEIGFDFKMNHIDRENIYCSVRHVEQAQCDTKIIMGLKFQNSDADFLADMQALLVQLDRIHRGKTYE